MPGRRTVLTLERRRRVVQLLSQGVSRNRAALAVGCAPSTITYQKLRDPLFAAAVLAARAAHHQRQARQLAITQKRILEQISSGQLAPCAPEKSVTERRPKETPGESSVRSGERPTPPPRRSADSGRRSPLAAEIAQDFAQSFGSAAHGRAGSHRPSVNDPRFGDSDSGG